MSATSYADSLGAFWVTPLKILGAYYAPGVALPFVWTNVKAQVTLPGGRTASRSDSVGGLGDLEFAFQLKFKQRDELREKGLDRAKRFFIDLQQIGRDWVSLGTTKTGTIYQLKGNPPQAHE